MLNSFFYALSFLLIANILQGAVAFMALSVNQPTKNDGVVKMCRLPDNQIGSCVPSMECEWYKHTYDASKILDIADFWRKYQCDNNYLYICCLTNTTSRSEITPQIKTGNAEIIFPQVNHQNNEKEVTQVTTRNDEKQVNNVRFNSRIRMCRLSDGQIGTCIPLNECEARKQELDKFVDHKDFWKKYRCGWKRNYVCCATNDQKDKPKNGKTVPAKLTVFKSQFSRLCGSKPVGPKILGGDFAALREFPWLVGVEHLDSTSGWEVHCGGSLINVRYVLTAAHCVKGLTKIAVRLGEYNLNTNPDCMQEGSVNVCNPPFVRRYISKIIVHEKYDDKSHLHDIALLRMDKMVDITDNIRSICLPENSTPLTMPKNLTVIGWGSTASLSINSSPKIMKVDVPLAEKKKCKKIFKEGYLPDEMICAGGIQGKDSCKGDSGGPLMSGAHFWTVDGIASKGKKCGYAGYAAVYTNVRSYLKWIKENVVDSFDD